MLQALEKFAEGGNALDQAYENSIQRIQCQAEEHTDLARKVLICITFGARPLTLDELRHAIAVDESTKELDPELDLDDPDVLISACAGLVTIDPETNTIRLVHYTTQKFLESLQNGFLSGSHNFLASCCLNYLLLGAFAQGHVAYAGSGEHWWAKYQRRIQRYPFLEYSARFWTLHLAMGQIDTSLSLQAFSLLDHFGHVASAFQALKGGYVHGHGFSPIHLLATMGSEKMLEVYINRGYPPNGMQNDRIRCHECKSLTLIHLDEMRASQLSWKEAITSLKTRKDKTPLLTAITSNISLSRSSTVALLLDYNKALINETDDAGKSPLWIAMEHEQESIALQLLREPDIVGPWYQNLYLSDCLPEAAGLGYEAVVDRLLELAVDMGASRVAATKMPCFPVPSKVAGRALLYAAGGGQLRTVQKLWKYSCDGQLQLPQGAGEDALHEAVMMSHFDVVHYLMNQDNIQPDTLDHKGMSDLHHAVRYGDAIIVDYILKNVQNIGIDLPDDDGRTPLSYAAAHGQVQVAQTLVSGYNANVDFADKDGMTPIMHAAKDNRCDMLAFLAPLVSDLNGTDRMGLTVVHHLAEAVIGWIFRENVEEFRSSLVCLVKHGAALDARDEAGSTAYDRLCDLETEKSQDTGFGPDYRQSWMELLKQRKEIMERMLCNPTVS